MPFQFPQKVLFKHCDPAGIVFYPRYFEMINDAVEALFADVLDWPFENIHQSGGVPTASFDVDFKVPSRHGDHLVLNLTVTQLGGSSLTVETRCRAADQLRFTAKQVLVHVAADGKPARWPDAIRAKLNDLKENQP